MALSLGMTFLGIMGAGKSVMGLGSTQAIAVDPSVPPATAELTRRGVQMWLESPTRRAATVANLIVSGLLVVAGMLLTLRRSSAGWWTAQALLANLLFTAGDTAATLLFLRGSSAELVPLIERYIGEQSQLAGAAADLSAAPTPGQFLMTLGGLAVGYGAMMGLIYALLWRVSRRADVRRFLDESAVREAE